MGLLKAGAGALGGVLADQWRDFFYCDALDTGTLAAKGRKRTSSRSSNTSGSENIVSDGSIIAVNEGQCMMIVESGAVVEVCAEPGEFLYETSSEPSIFHGDLGESIKRSFAAVGKRFAFGADAPKDQRVYYFNTKEIVGNKYGTASPVPFRVVDSNIGLDVDIALRCNGEYSYRLTDPLLFYKNVCGNVEDPYTRDRIDSQLKSELLTALQPAFARISNMGVRYSAIPGHAAELADILNEELSQDWSELRGISVASFGVNSIAASPEDEAMIKELQKAAVMRDPAMAAANIVAAQSDAMRAAASNENGALMGFMGMGMAGAAGGMNAGNLFQIAQQPAAASSPRDVADQEAPRTPTVGTATAPQAAKPGWSCSCGASNMGNFCQNCGSKRPENAAWTCACGSPNTGNFCQSCGSARA